MKLFIMLLLLAIPVAGWGAEELPKALTFIAKGSSDKDGSIFGVRATEKKCVYYWYFGEGPRDMAIIKNDRAVTMHINKGKPIVNSYWFADGDVVDEDGERYVDGSITYGLFVSSMIDCKNHSNN